jgi:hypothetical protein
VNPPASISAAIAFICIVLAPYLQPTGFQCGAGAAIVIALVVTILAVTGNLSDFPCVYQSAPDALGSFVI